MTSTIALALMFAIGMIAGLRALTAPAVICWAAHLGWLNLQNSHLAWMGSTAAVAIFSILALAEIINDKLPATGSRLAPPSLVIRSIMGAVAGSALAIAASHSVVVGIALGALGALAGAYVGYQVRHQIVAGLKIPDFPVALLEDAIAIGCGLLIVSRF
ncbi:MAG TPA: DUF4126 family protein [Candidatus Acidoferrales bacterium]